MTASASVAPRAVADLTMNAGRAAPASFCILVCDPDPGFAQRLQSAAADIYDACRVVRAASAMDAVTRMESSLLDLVVIRYRDRIAEALKLTTRAAALDRDIQIVAQLPRADADLASRAIAAGATTCVVENDAVIDHRRMLIAFRRGVVPMNTEIAIALIQRYRDHVRCACIEATACEDGGALLTSRETEILHMSARGLKQREVAGALDLSPHTISGYFKRIYEKLGVNSRSEAIYEAQALGLIER